MLIRTILSVFILFVLFQNARGEIDPIVDRDIRRLVVLDVDATINPATANYLQTEFARAETDQHALMVIRLNTPGGLVSTTKDILALIGRTSLPVVVWVTPEGASATSAGAIIASSAHALYMNKGTNIGAATPVGLGEDLKESDGRSKAVNDLSALVKSLAETRGRNKDAFQKMISQADSYTADEAAKAQVIEGIATSLDDLRGQLAGKTVSIRGQKQLLKFASALEIDERPMDMGQRLLNVFAHPSTAYILFVIGAALIYFEFQAPGGYVAGAVGVLCLLTAGISFQVLPLNYGAIGLLVAGLVFLVLEIFITSYGLLAIAGVACLVAGSLFLYRHEDGWMTVQYPIIFSTLAGVLASLGFLAWYLVRHRQPKAQFFNLVGQTGNVTRIVGIEGQTWRYQVKVGGETWNAQSHQEIADGDVITVLSQSSQNLHLEIAKKA